MSDRRDAPVEAEEPPPVLGSWNRIYVLVLAALTLCILLFWLFERAYS